MVVVRHVDREVEVESIVLEACSPVLREMLVTTRDGDGTQSIAMTDANAVVTLLAVAALNTQHATRSFTSRELAAILPLAHKYNCSGIMTTLQSASNEHPLKNGIFHGAGAAGVRHNAVA